MKSIIESVALTLAVFVGVFMFLLLLFSPLIIWDGYSKAAYIKQSQGIELPWYQATWLDVNASGNAIMIKEERK